MNINFITAVVAIVQVVLLVLKFLGTVSWGWVWVLSPTWGLVLFVLFIFLLISVLEIWGSW